MAPRPRRGLRATLTALLLALAPQRGCSNGGDALSDITSGSAWLRLSTGSSTATDDEALGAGDPRWRYSHGMAPGLHSPSVVISHGYNLRDPAGNNVPDWRDDTWELVPATEQNGVAPGGGRASGWRRLAASSPPPPSRYGGALLRLGDLLVLFGGDDGGIDTSTGGRSGYVWGSYRNDVWVLPPREGAGWVRAVSQEEDAVHPDVLSLHACTAVPDPLADVDTVPAEVGLCFGGLTSPLDGAGRRGTRDPGVGTGALADTGNIWILHVAPLYGEGGDRAPPIAYEARWTFLDPSGMGDAASGIVTAPPPRHGAGIAHTARVLLRDSASAPVVIEHSLLVFGGGGLGCDVAGLLSGGYELGVDVAVADESAVASGKLLPCQYGDLWRLVWSSGEVPRWQRLASGGDSDGPGEEEGADAAAAARGLSPGEVAARAAGRSFAAATAGRLSGGSGASGSHPRPRSMPGFATAANGAVLFGGAACLPACDCLGDTWHLVVAPLWAEPRIDWDARPFVVDAGEAGFRWVKASVAGVSGSGVAVSSSGATGRLLAPWLAAPAYIVSGVGSLIATDGVGKPLVAPGVFVGTGAGGSGAAPAPRYRHGLTSDSRAALADVQALATAIEGAGAQRRWSWTPASLPVFLFGGETYTPASRYFGDTWLLVDDAAAALSASAPLCLVGEAGKPAALGVEQCPAVGGSKGSASQQRPAVGPPLSTRLGVAFNAAAARLGVSPLAIKLLALALVLSALANRASSARASATSSRPGGAHSSQCCSLPGAATRLFSRGAARWRRASLLPSVSSSSPRSRLDEAEPLVVVEGSSAAVGRPLRHRG